MRRSIFRTLSRTHGGLSGGILEIPWYKNRRERRSYFVTRTRERAATVVTLDPNKFAEKKQQIFYLGNKHAFPFFVKQANQRVNHRLCYDWTTTAPPDIKAFLYYTILPGRPRIGGELRFRVTSSDDPASFASGSDLLRKNGLPWFRPLFTISRTHTSLYQKLREEGLVSDDLDSILSSLPFKRLMYSIDHLLYSFNDEFIVDFGAVEQTFSILTEKGMVRTPFRGHFSDSRVLRRGLPYTGSATARFERSTLPVHKGTRTVVLRFLKIITPAKCVTPLYDGYIALPKKGELFHRHWNSQILKPDPPVWSIDIDKSNNIVVPGLKWLWDA